MTNLVQVALDLVRARKEETPEYWSSHADATLALLEALLNHYEVCIERAIGIEPGVELALADYVKDAT